MSRLALYSIFIFLATLASGCKSTYKNISAEPDFLRYIGKTYVLKNNMSIRGINLPPGYSSKINIYMISKLYEVHHKAPEEITFAVLPKGSTITIIEVHECTNCLSFQKLREAYITTEDFEKAVDVPISIPMYEIESNENVTPIK
jgi:hypothetical protein